MVYYSTMFGVRQFFRKSVLLSTCFPKYSQHILSATNYSTKTGEKGPEIIDDGPIKYSKSAAGTYDAKITRTGVSVPRLWYEPYIIMVSLTVFMLYFMVFREENDIDEELGRSLYSRISGLEEHQLKLSLEFNKDHGRDTTDIVKRLEEIELEKQKSQEF